MTTNRRKKQTARTRQRHEAVQRERSRARRTMADWALEEAASKVRAMLDPKTPPAEVAAHFLDMYEDDRLAPHGFSLALGADVEGKAAEVAEEALRMAPGTLTALALAADVAEVADDLEEAEERYRAAFGVLALAANGDGGHDEPAWARPGGHAPAAGDDEEDGSSTRVALSTRLAGVLVRRDRVADALDLLFDVGREDPGYSPAHSFLGAALADASERRTMDPAEPCPCGSDLTHGECCRPREAAALPRFEDRSPMYELRDELRPFLERPEIDAFVMEGISDWYLGETPEEMGDPGETEVRLAVERLLVVSGPRPDDEHNTLLDAFADDPAAPAPLARRAREWRTFVRFGAWEVANPGSAPGVLLEDLVTGRFVFAAVPPEQLEHLPRWSVLLGAMLPVDGIWRSGAGFLAMTPNEGRAVAADALRMGRAILPDLLPRRLVGEVASELDERRRALRASLPSDELEPLSPAAATVMDKLVAAALPQLRDVLREMRAEPVDLRNTDGERMELITRAGPAGEPAGGRGRDGGRRPVRERGPRLGLVRRFEAQGRSVRPGPVGAGRG